MVIVEVAPYWNVNRIQDSRFHHCYTVEVAPYWNVNIAGKVLEYYKN